MVMEREGCEGEFKEGESRDRERLLSEHSKTRGNIAKEDISNRTKSGCLKMSTVVAQKVVLRALTLLKVVFSGRCASCVTPPISWYTPHVTRTVETLKDILERPPPEENVFGH